MKNFDFVGRKKLFAGISLGILVVGLLFTAIFGVELDIAFKGGTLLKYSYQGDIDEPSLDSFVDTKLPGADAQLTTNDLSDTKLIHIYYADKLTVEQQDAFFEALSAQYAANALGKEDASSLDPSMGSLFFLKCLVAIVLACILLTIYVAFRFRKIGGWTAGIMALVALFNDLMVAFFIFVFFRIPLNDNFVAVLLSILGYSLNATIVVYDRIRENRRKMDKKTPLADIVNLSINQSFTRSLNTSLCTFVAIAVVAVMAVAMSLSSITSFALPMMFGVLSGFYTSTFLCAPLWVGWMNWRERRGKTPKKA